MTPISHKNCWCGGGISVTEEEVICLDSDFHDPTSDGRPKVIRKLYVAGPMSGYPQNNYPLFHLVSERLEQAGYEVVNPAAVGVPGKDRVHYVDLIRQDLIDMLGCDGIAVLPHWWESVGARNEVQVAGILKMPIHPWTLWVDFHPSGDE